MCKKFSDHATKPSPITTKEYQSSVFSKISKSSASEMNPAAVSRTSRYYIIKNIFSFSWITIIIELVVTATVETIIMITTTAPIITTSI